MIAPATGFSLSSWIVTIVCLPVFLGVPSLGLATGISFLVFSDTIVATYFVSLFSDFSLILTLLNTLSSPFAGNFTSVLDVLPVALVITVSETPESLARSATVDLSVILLVFSDLE